MWSQNVHASSLALEPLVEDAVMTSDHHEVLEEGIRISTYLKHNKAMIIMELQTKSKSDTGRQSLTVVRHDIW